LLRGMLNDRLQQLLQDDRLHTTCTFCTCTPTLLSISS
jgi:hypothetical protein